MKNQKYILTAAVLACTLALSACGGNDKTNENKDPLTGEDMSQNESGGESETSGDNESASAGNHGEFESMLNDENTDPNNIMDYINTNIVEAGVDDVERFFKGLLGFGDDIRNLDFTRLESSRQYMPEDMIAFMDLMKLEADTPSMAMSDEENRKVINMTLSEMLERALLFEQHLEKYPDNVTTEAASRLYEEIASNAISGGYNKTEGIAHYYKGDTDDMVDKEALQYYKQFAEANPDSNLGKIVKEYIDVLQTNQFKINDTMEDFYMGLHERLALDKWANSENQNETGTTDVNQTGTNGTDTNQTGANQTGANQAGANQAGTAGTDTKVNNRNSNASNNKGANAADTVIQGTVNR